MNETQALAGNPHLEVLGYKPGSLVRILGVKFEGMLGADELIDQLATILFGNASSVTLEAIVMGDNGQYEYRAYTLPWGSLALQRLNEGGRVTHLRYWFMRDVAAGLGDIEDHDVSEMGATDRRSLLKEYLGGITTETVFALVEMSCDNHGLGGQIEGVAGGSVHNRWQGALDWGSYDLDKGDALALRACLLDEFLRREGESALTFAQRAIRSLEALATSDTFRDGAEKDGRLALIGMAWGLLQEARCTEAAVVSLREVAMGLLRRALKVEYESPDGMTAFWAGVPPLPGMEEEHGRMVLEAVTAHLERADVPWNVIRSFLYEGGIDRAMRPLEKLGLSPNVFAQAMLKRWGADPDIAVFAKGSPTSFASHDQTAAIEVLIDGMRTYEAHVVARVVGGRSALWQRLDDGQKARLVESVRLHLVADRQFAERLWMVRDQLPHPFEGEIVKAYNGY